MTNPKTGRPLDKRQYMKLNDFEKGNKRGEITILESVFSQTLIATIDPIIFFPDQTQMIRMNIVISPILQNTLLTPS